MTLRGYLTTMIATTIVLWLVFVFVITSIDPTITNFFGFALFYLSLFLALSGTFSILGFLWRFRYRQRALAFHSVNNAFRQSFLLAFFVVAILFLLSKGLFTWLNLILLIIIVVILEYFLTSSKKQKV